MKNILFNYISIIIIIIILFYSQKAFTAYVPVGKTLDEQIVTSYWPGAGGSIEGKWETSKPRPGATGNWKTTNVPSTLEMVRKGESNYVTIAADPSHYKEWYTIPKITYTNTKGETYTMYNVKAYVHDTGEAFQGRQDKFDIAIDRGTGFSSGSGLDKQLIQNAGSLEKQGIVFERNDGKGETKTTWESGKVSGKGTKPIETKELCALKPTEAERQECEQKQETQKPTQEKPQQTQKTEKPPQQTTKTPTTYSTPFSGGGSAYSTNNRLCYKYSGPPGRKGLKLAETCNGGFKCYIYGCGDDEICYSSYFVVDCGPNNIFCDSAAHIAGGGYCPPKESNPQDGPLAGCLNYKCKTKNAIWDMDSKKCGCDDGSMSSVSGATPSGPGTTKPTQPTTPKQPTQTPPKTGTVTPPKESGVPQKGGSGPSYIKKEDLRTQITKKLEKSKLNGYVPSDGAKYGITTGSPEEWANYFTELAGKESSYNNNAAGDIGRFGTGSNGLFQLSQNDAVNYKLNGGKPFTMEQLRDPDTNMDAAISIHESLVIKNNSIKNGAGRYWGPVQRGWTPYIPSK